MNTLIKGFVIFAWVFAIATQWNTASGVMLMLAGAMVIIDTICEWRKKNAKR